MTDAALKERLAAIRLVALDLDGTIYKDNSVFPWTNPFLALLDGLGIRYTFLTNNCSRSARDYVTHLRELGVEAEAEQVFTSGLATVEFLRREYPHVGRLFILGTASLREEFRAAGFMEAGGDANAGEGVARAMPDESPAAASDEPEAVVVGFDSSLQYERLCLAGYWIKRGKPFIATHPDLVCPTDRPTLLVDCGAICACLAAACGRGPDAVVGKPDPRMLAGILAHHGLEPWQLAMVGDRIYTDMAMARAAGALGVLVLSGEATSDDAERSPAPPDIVVSNLEEFGQLMQHAIECGSRARKAP